MHSTVKEPGSESGESKQETYIRWLRQTVARPTTKDDELHAQAWKVARAAAQLLRDRYQVSRVRAFGSLVHPERFHPDSDVDVAVEGLRAEDYWEAVTATLFLDERIRVDLLDRAVSRPGVWKAVEREGVDL
jgi:predicted nucleotidyltransferase